MIRRAERRARYVVIDRAAVDDPRLSYRALGLLVYVLSKPDNWRVHVQHLATQHTEGREAVRTALNELLALGYATRTRANGEGGRLEWELVIHECPQLDLADEAVTIAQKTVDGSTVDGSSVAGEPAASKEPGSESLGSENSPPTDLFGGTAAPTAGGGKRGKAKKELTGIELVADGLARERWEATTVKPVCGFPALRARIAEALDAGHSEDSVRRALPSMTVFSRNSFDLTLGRQAGSGRRPVDDDRTAISGGQAL